MKPTGTGAIDSFIIDSEEARAALDYAEASTAPGAGAVDVDRLQIPQRNERYTSENHEVWRTIVQKRMTHLDEEGAGSRVFLAGANVIDLPMNEVPSLERLNSRLFASTGWSSFGVPTRLPAKAFFACLAERRFPTTITVRPKSSMNYLPEPDIIHDVFGHVPCTLTPRLADFLQTWGRTALLTSDPLHGTPVSTVLVHGNFQSHPEEAACACTIRPHLV